jgi:hypothetical protein
LSGLHRLARAAPTHVGVGLPACARPACPKQRASSKTHSSCIIIPNMSTAGWTQLAMVATMSRCTALCVLLVSANSKDCAIASWQQIVTQRLRCLCRPLWHALPTARPAVRLAQLHQQAMGPRPSGCFPGQHPTCCYDVTAQGARSNSRGTGQDSRCCADQGGSVLQLASSCSVYSTQWMWLGVTTQSFWLGACPPLFGSS